MLFMISNGPIPNGGCSTDGPGSPKGTAPGVQPLGSTSLLLLTTPGSVQKTCRCGTRGCGLVAGLGSAGLMTGLNDLRGLLQTESFYG